MLPCDYHEEDLKTRSNDIIDFDGARKAAENIIDLSYITGKSVRRTLDKVSYDKELMSAESAYGHSRFPNWMY